MTTSAQDFVGKIQLSIPVKYKIDGGYLWTLAGADETWMKAYYLYGASTASILNQGFGARPEVYAKFGLSGHNGLDLYALTGTALYAPCDGIISETTVNDAQGYGTFIRMHGNQADQNFELCFGHLTKILISLNQHVKAGDIIGICDNSGFSSGSHLHYGFRLLDKSMSILNYTNGYYGSLDFSMLLPSLVITETNDLKKLYDYANAQGSRYGYYFGWGGADHFAEACKKLGIIGRVTRSQYYDFILFSNKN